MNLMIARWETRGKKHWYELHKDTIGYWYRMDGGGGNLGPMTQESAISFLETKIANAKQYDGINMRRVI